MRLFLLLFLFFLGQKLTFSQNQLPDYIPSEGLLYYSNFNGNSYDLSGNGYETLVIGCSPAEDRFGQVSSAIYFQGSTEPGTNSTQVVTDSYIEVFSFDHSFSTSGYENQLTISFWVKHEWNDQNGPGGGIPLVNRRINNSIDFDLSASYGDNNVPFSPALHLGEWSESSGQGFPNNWVHFVVTYDTNSVKYYMNNQLYATFDNVQNGPISNITDRLLIGKHIYSSHTYFFNGWLDDFAIWNRALSYTEITGLYTLNTSDIYALDMAIYPNPVNGDYVTIQTPLNGDRLVEVFDVNGRKVMERLLTTDTLNVGSISAGMYIVKVTVEGQSNVSKLIIK